MHNQAKEWLWIGKAVNNKLATDKNGKSYKQQLYNKIVYNNSPWISSRSWYPFSFR